MLVIGKPTTSNIAVCWGGTHIGMDKPTHNDYVPYPTEYPNNLITGGLPLAKLALKPGCPIMLLWNLDPT
jgi:hypothetical protein